MAKKKTIIEISKNTGENNASMLRRFSRKVQESQVIQKVKGKRYNEREKSELKRKRETLKKLKRRKEVEKLKKLGKMR